MEEFWGKYNQRILEFIDRYEQVYIKYVTKYYKVVRFLMICFFVLFDTGAKVGSYFYKTARYMTWPFHWIWVLVWAKQYTFDLEKIPIFNVGAHYIYGRPAAGKSTMTYHAMMQYAYSTGKCSYTTANMEIPRKNLGGAEYYYHLPFRPSEFYEGGEQVKSFDHEHFNFIVYEEMLTEYNQRKNKEREYNDEVIPLVASIGTQRHQSIDIFFFISQLPRTDVQLMLMMSGGYHIPKVKKGFDYPLFMETGQFRFTIKGWKMKSYSIVPTGGNDYKLEHNKNWFYPNVLPEDMKYFNRLNMKKKFDALPKHEARVYA